MKRAGWLAAVALAACLLAEPETALNAAREAMASWAEAVAPALFPFMALMPMLTCGDAVRAYERLLGWAARPLFRLPGGAAPAIVIGMAAGSPAGAMAAVRVAAQAGLRRDQLERLVACACGLSPAFLVSGVGAAMLGSPADGWILLRAQLGTQLLLLAATRWMSGGGAPVPASEGDSAAAIGGAVRGVLNVCGYMVLFNVLGAMAAALAGGGAGTALVCMLDLPSGARAVAAMPLPREGKLLALAAMSGFGGICIAAQNLAACRAAGVRASRYFAARLAAAALATGLTAAQLGVKIDARPVLRALPAAALTACLLAIPVWFGWRRNFLLTKRPARKSPHFAPKIAQKAQDVVMMDARKRHIMCSSKK